MLNFFSPWYNPKFKELYEKSESFKVGDRVFRVKNGVREEFVVVSIQEIVKNELWVNKIASTEDEPVLYLKNVHGNYCYDLVSVLNHIE
jgi:hypothetical protein